MLVERGDLAILKTIIIIITMYGVYVTRDRPDRSQDSTQRDTWTQVLDTSKSVSINHKQIQNYYTYNSHSDLSPVPVRSAVKPYLTPWLTQLNRKLRTQVYTANGKMRACGDAGLQFRVSWVWV